MLNAATQDVEYVLMVGKLNVSTKKVYEGITHTCASWIDSSIHQSNLLYKHAATQKTSPWGRLQL